MSDSPRVPACQVYVSAGMHCPNEQKTFGGSIKQAQGSFSSNGNPYLVGRNGVHRYGNQDHSMLTEKLRGRGGS